MIRGLLFDLDGVLVNTNPLHARAWQELAEELGIPFTPADQEAFLGISRAQCLEILLKKGNRSLSESEKERLCTRKNDRYREMIGTLTPAALLLILGLILCGLAIRARQQLLVETQVAVAPEGEDLTIAEGYRNRATCTGHQLFTGIDTIAFD